MNNKDTSAGTSENVGQNFFWVRPNSLPFVTNTRFSELMRMTQAMTILYRDVHAAC